MCYPLFMEQESITCQGRSVTMDELTWLRDILTDNPQWSRQRIISELCIQWGWQTARGQYKTFAAREFLIKLNHRGLITLPAVQVQYRRTTWAKPVVEALRMPEPAIINGPLAELQPLKLLIPEKSSTADKRFMSYLAAHHYLGFKKTVGESIKYLIQDKDGRDVACLLFGSAAWKTAPRDAFIGWSDEIRRRHVNFLTNNTRYLILPWVTVKHLASHILGAVMRRIGHDWQEAYGHTIHMVETFVERDRFRGTCYKAAGWQHIGVTRGRSRQDRYNSMQVPVKDIYVYPLISGFREVLREDTY